MSAGLSGNTPSMRRPLSLSSTMVPMPTYSPDRLASASLTASGVRNVVWPSSPTASVIPLMAAWASDWSSRSDAPTYSLWRRSHDLRMSANASSPVGFCDGSALPRGHRRRSARRDPAQVERADGGEPTVDEDPDGEGEQRHHHEHRRAEPAALAPRFGRRSDASGATGTATPVTSSGGVDGSAAASGVVGGVTTGSTGAGSVEFGRREGHRRVTGAIEAGAAGVRPSRTRDHRPIFADDACGRDCGVMKVRRPRLGGLPASTTADQTRAAASAR